MAKGYCVKCKANVEMRDAKEVVKDTKRGKKKFLNGKCPNCNTAVWKVLGNA
ncbi:MAG: DUF5679 domain-containing protein [Candidatus Anstonellales archaeon]